MNHTLRFLCTTILMFTILNFGSIWSQDILVAPDSPITLGLGTIEDMAFSPDGKYIATASSLGITLWDAENLNLVKTLYSSTEKLYLRKTLGTSQDYSYNSYYYDCGDNSTSHKWSRAIPARNSEENQLCIKFSPDGNFITNGIEVWNVNDGTTTTSDDYVEDWSIIESANNRFYVVPTDSVAPEDGVISTNSGYSYSVESDYNSDNHNSTYTLKIQTVEGKSVATIESQVTPRFAKSYPMSVRFSPDGKTLGVLWNTLGGKVDHIPLDTSAVLYDLTKDGSPLGTLGHHFDWITSVTFSPNNNVVATTRWQAIDLWNVDTGKHLHTLDIPKTLVRVWKVSFSADGNLIATTRSEGPFLIWQVDTGELVFSSEGSDIKVNDVALHPDGESVAFIGQPTSSEQSNLYIWEISEEHPQILQKTDTYGRVEFSPDGSKLVNKHYKCTVWNTDKYLLMYEIDDCWAKNKSSPDSKFLIVWDSYPDYMWDMWEHDDDSYLTGARLYGLEQGNLLSHIPHSININSVDFSLEGDKLITVGFDGLLLMDAEKQSFIEKISNYNYDNWFPSFSSIAHAAFTLEDRIITFHINGDICLWETPDPNRPDLGWPRGTLLPLKHQKSFFDVTTSFNKRTIATRNVDGTVTLFPIDYSNDVENSNLACRSD